MAQGNAQNFVISSNTKTLFSADDKEVVVGTDKLRVTGTIMSAVSVSHHLAHTCVYSITDMNYKQDFHSFYCNL